MQYGLFYIAWMIFWIVVINDGHSMLKEYLRMVTPGLRHGWSPRSPLRIYFSCFSMLLGCWINKTHQLWRMQYCGHLWLYTSYTALVFGSLALFNTQVWGRCTQCEKSKLKAGSIQIINGVTYIRFPSILPNYLYLRI